MGWASCNMGGLPGEVGIGLDGYNLQNQGRTFADVPHRDATHTMATKVSRHMIIIAAGVTELVRRMHTD